LAALDEAAAAITQRLEELEGEREKLLRALGELGVRAPTARRGKRARKGRALKPSGPRRGGPTRKEQVLTEARANPSIRPGELAEALGISANHVSNLLSSLKREGSLHLDKKGRWVVR
jgi:DNA-binding transcriptional ArsR family regulator